MTTTDDPMTRALRQIAVAPRMERMADLFGVAGALTRIERWRSDEMDARCAQCRRKPDCDALLSDRRAHPDDAGFCPNRDHFRLIAALGY